MQPSSLVFLVIIAIWAAYFVQHWVRRREHLATARSVDRFSESMRVLEHRAALPVADLSAPQPRSYAVSPARPARPEILVKRAGRAPETVEAVGASAAGRAGAPGDASSAQDAAAPQRQSVAPSRRVRGLTLLGSLASVLVFLVLAAFGVLPWLAVLAPVAAVGGALVWVRSGVAAEQAARRAARAGGPALDNGSAGVRPGAARPARTAGRPAGSAHASRVPQARPEPSASVSSSAPQRGEAEQADPEPATVRDSFYDVEAVERASGPHQTVHSPAAAVAGQQVPVGPLVDEDDIPLTWDPVPVPRPTYTMKAVVPRTQAPPVGHGVPPEMADAAYDEPVRRVAGA
ncbi:hypothetical protein SAMN05216199_3874 [Pedococcus cremeus]|uniref:Uncharacterized protein n=1 Tax=Pedococcus cremeus TaxID=587636 RepID=A0A1H9XIU0_9MICO|nr:hypothetical protein [Pedococcus cremeus]SES45961.1 hypothetical protein SAMN05216199_3874 [Pedococcus cremeus]